MHEPEYAELQNLEKEGKCIVGVGRPTAKTFFLRVPISQVEAETGYAPYFEKGVVFLFFLAGPICLVGSILAAFLAFGWWGLIAVIIGFPVYLTYFASSSRGRAGARLISLIMLIAAVAHFFDSFLHPAVTRFILLYVLALWSARMLYVTATSFYRNMALMNAKLYNLMSGGIVLRHLT